MLEPEDDKRMISMDTLVMNEDARVLLGIKPILQPQTNIKENLMPSDSHMAHYRGRLKAYEARGWRINQDEVDRNKNQVAYAIPSPARRASKNWTLDSIPLIAPEVAEAAVKIVR